MIYVDWIYIDAALISVSRAGFTDSATAGLALGWRPEDIIAAFA
jgi:hypothetical protein